MGYAQYHATCWAAGRTDEEIKAEIARCEARYLKPYPWNGTENAELTIQRINALQEILQKRKI